jgi:hypothetical protein
MVTGSRIVDQLPIWNTAANLDHANFRRKLRMSNDWPGGHHQLTGSSPYFSLTKMIVFD